MNPFLNIYIQGFRKGAEINLDTLKATAEKFVTPDRSGPGSASDIGIGAGAGAAAGAAIGGLSGLVAPGRDEDGNRRSRLRTALRRALAGGTLGGAAGAAGGYLKGPEITGAARDYLDATKVIGDRLQEAADAMDKGDTHATGIHMGAIGSDPSVQRFLGKGTGWEDHVPRTQEAIERGILRDLRGNQP